MEDYHISAFIDDQLELDEKIQFVETVHADKAFKEETLSFLVQEQQLRSPAADQQPQMALKRRQASWSWGWLKPLGFYGGGLATALLLIFLFSPLTQIPTATVAHRFVIYQPDVQTASLVGSFSDWKAVNMQPKGTSGYWEITVALPPGEHRYSFLLDGQRQVADPTVQVQERDDFGGVNSIISVQAPMPI
jgi:hypothetical protein